MLPCVNASHCLILGTISITSKIKIKKKFWEGNIVIKHLMGYCEILHSWKVWSIRWWLRDPGFPGWNFTPSSRDRWHVEIKLGPAKAGQFSTWHLFRFACNIFDFFLCNHVSLRNWNPIDFHWFKLIWLELFRFLFIK